LICVDEYKLLREIEKLLGYDIPQVVIAGYEPDRNAKPEPIVKRRGSRSSAAKPKRARTEQPRRRKHAGRRKHSQGKRAQSR
ncbi:MAG: ATP-dependent RNA helicase RhlE, partial [Gammaproteobacteria bacterium]